MMVDGFLRGNHESYYFCKNLMIDLTNYKSIFLLDTFFITTNIFYIIDYLYYHEGIAIMPEDVYTPI